MIRVLFDNTEIDGNYIMSLTQIAQPYNQYFSIGNTVCRQFDIVIRNEGFSSVPDEVILYEDNNSDVQSEWTKYATLLVDSVEIKDETSTTFSLTDLMVRFNVPLSYTVGDHCLGILTDICTNKGISLIRPAILFLDDFIISWEDNISERDLISYMAEVNGGYAYIDADGNLNIDQYSNTSAGTVDANFCSSFKIGEKHIIDRVYCELGTATQYYPSTGQYDTLYLNPNNILLTGNDDYTTRDILENIYSVVNGLTFYTLSIEQCPTISARACQMLNFISDSIAYPFLCSINYDYRCNWYGGYSCDVKSGLQEETKISESAELNRRINISVDRQLGTIEQSISELSDNVAINSTTIQQTASDLTVRVAAAENNISSNGGRITTLESSVKITSTGVEVSNGTAGSYTNFTASGMDIYVENTKTAWASSEGFASEELMIGGANDSEKWHMHMANDGYTLMFLRR